MSERNSPSTTDSTIRLMLVILLMLSLLIVLIVFTWEDRFEFGEIVLTEQGCQALIAHGVQPEPIADSGLCRVRAQFERSSRIDRLYMIRPDTEHGRITIEIAGSLIVSKLTD